MEKIRLRRKTGRRWTRFVTLGWGMLLLCLAPFAAGAAELRKAAPAECVPRVGDYTYMWWAHGFRARSRDGRPLRCIQTGRYAMVMDVEKMQITHLGPVADPLAYEQAAARDNSVFADLPAAELKLSITVDGRQYRCVRGGRRTQHSGPRLIESGRFVQRADITDLVFEDKEGRGLGVDGRFEVVAWPGRLTLLLAAGPAGKGPRAGAVDEVRIDEWKNASMSIRLRVGEETISGRAALKGGEVWASGNIKTAAISLTPGAKGSQAAPAPAAISVKAGTIPDNRPRPVDYDPVRGWYRVDLDGIEPRGKHNDVIERVKVSLANPESHESIVRLLFDKNGAGMRVRGIAPMTGLSPMLRDSEGCPLGIPVQISKNWHRQRDLELTYQGTWLHAFTMLRLPARCRVDLELTLAYAHWGGVAAASHAQLCLIGWGSNQLWDQAAIGAWGENICYEPDQAQAAAAVLDVRPLMVHSMNQDRPRRWHWTNNVGGGDFFRYFDAKGERQFPARMKTAYLRYCPNLTEVTYAGRSQDATIEHRATVSIYRTDDITRGVYRLRLDAKKRTDFKRMVFFQVGADTYSYTGERKMAVGNEDGLGREWATRWGGARYKSPPTACKGRIPWISMHEAVSRDGSKWGAWANRGIIIRRWDARLGGRGALPWAAEYGVKARGKDTSVIDIVPPPGVRRLAPGDYVEATFEHVIVPQYARDYYGPNENLRAALKKYENTWRMIHREALGNDLSVNVSRGTLRRARPTLIRADEANRAQFTIAGGLGYAPVTISGLSDYRNPVLEIRQGDGPWRTVDQSVHGRDFWQADYVPATRTWEVTYNVPLDSPADARRRREIRFRIGGAGKSR